MRHLQHSVKNETPKKAPKRLGCEHRRLKFSPIPWRGRPKAGPLVRAVRTRRERTNNGLRRGHGLPMRGNNHLIICRYGSPLDGIRSTAFLAKGLACSSVCRLSFGSDIHSRMIFRRASCSGFMSKSFGPNGGRRRGCLKLIVPVASAKTRYQKQPSETGGGNCAFGARSGTRRLNHFPRMARNRGDFESPPANNGGDRTGWLGREDSNLRISIYRWPFEESKEFPRFP
jgi:hypothetical protein